MSGRKKAAFPEVTADDALAALRWLHALGRVTSKDIEKALSRRAELVAEIRAKLEALGGQGGRFLTGPRELQRRPAAKKRRRKVFAKARAVWRLQGRYLGAVKPLSPAQRAKVKRIREAKGVAAAITAAKRLAR